jgi:hypothetical protein
MQLTFHNVGMCVHTHRKRGPALSLLPLLIIFHNMEVRCAGMFNLLRRSIPMAPSTMCDTLESHLQVSKAVRAHIPGSVLPLTSSDWTLSIEFRTNASEGIFLAMPGVVLVRSGRSLLALDDKGVSLGQQTDIDWPPDTFIFSIARSVNDGPMGCIGGRLLGGLQHAFNRASLDRGITLGDPKSKKSLPGTVKAVYAAAHLANCTQMGMVSTNQPVAEFPPRILQLNSSQGTDMFVGEATLVACTAENPSDSIFKIRLTVFGLPPPNCVTAECGHIFTVCSPPTCGIS